VIDAIELVLVEFAAEFSYDPPPSGTVRYG
jgi:hypothetical protein